MTRAQQAGLRIEDVPRPSLAKLRRQHKLDALVRAALKPVLRRRQRQRLDHGPDDPETSCPRPRTSGKPLSWSERNFTL
jgi:hypothetical protein